MLGTEDLTKPLTLRVGGGRSMEEAQIAKTLAKAIAENDQKTINEMLQRIIACMSYGMDMSSLFPQVVQAAASKDLAQKKLVYTYLIHYAGVQPDLSVLAVNTLRKDAEDDNPLTRAHAIRSICSLRLALVLDYSVPILLRGLSDPHPYVRKSAVLGCTQIARTAPLLATEHKFSSILSNLVHDADPFVCLNSLSALEELSLAEGGLKPDRALVLELVNRLQEFTDAGKCIVLNVISRYNPATLTESDSSLVFDLLNVLDPLLRSLSTGLVLSVSRVFILYTMEMTEIHKQALHRLKAPLLSAFASTSDEEAHCVLAHIRALSLVLKGVFSADFRVFYCKRRDPDYLKIAKTEILPIVADEESAKDILLELSEYVKWEQESLVAASLSAIVSISKRFPALAEFASERLLTFLDMHNYMVAVHTLAHLPDFLSTLPVNTSDFLREIEGFNILAIQNEDALCSVVWLLGEFGEDLSASPYLLEALVAQYPSLTLRCKLELLTALCKLILNRPAEVQPLLGVMLARSSQPSELALLQRRSRWIVSLLQQLADGSISKEALRKSFFSPSPKISAPKSVSLLEADQQQDDTKDLSSTLSTTHNIDISSLRRQLLLSFNSAQISRSMSEFSLAALSTSLSDYPPSSPLIERLVPLV